MDIKKEEVGALLDELYLEMFDLIEQQAASRVNIERLSNGGQLLLAKTRYVHGSQTVSVAQIPTENGKDFNALCYVEDCKKENNFCNSEYKLIRQPIDKSNGYVEPMNWFAVLAPSSLRAAADQFKKCINFVVESANIQRELTKVINNINCLKNIMVERFN